MYSFGSGSYLLVVGYLSRSRTRSVVGLIFRTVWFWKAVDPTGPDRFGWVLFSRLLLYRRWPFFVHPFGKSFDEVESLMNLLYSMFGGRYSKLASWIEVINIILHILPCYLKFKLRLKVFNGVDSWNLI